MATGVTGVWQTYISNTIGQKVMHDLRAAVYRHLQRMSLAFFTRTRTGEVQSRIANDIGGIDSVVTTTATSVASNATTVIATIVAMVMLDWRLAVASLIFVPPFVWLTRRVGQVRRRISTERQSRLADLSALVSESLSVSGIMLGKTMGRGRDLAERFTDESREIAEIEVRSRMAGRWVMSTIQMVFAIQPALVYWIAGQSFVHGGHAISIGTVVAFTQLQTRLLFPIQSLLSTQADLEASLALFDRIFEYLDLPVDIVEAADPVTLVPERVLGEVRLDHVYFRYGAWRRLPASEFGPNGGPASAGAELASKSPRGGVPGTRSEAICHGPWRTSTSSSLRAPAPRSWGRPGRARRRSAIWSRACTSPRRDGCASTASTCARPASSRWPPRSGSSPRRPTCSTRACARTCASPSRRPPTPRSRRRRARRASTT